MGNTWPLQGGQGNLEKMTEGLKARMAAKYEKNGDNFSLRRGRQLRREPDFEEDSFSFWDLVCSSG